jgi:hypothetical protein
MSFVMFLIVGLSAGVVLYTMAQGRIRVPLGLIGALLVGIAAAFAGGCLGALVAGTPPSRITTGTVAGAAFGAYATVGLMAALAHYRNTHGQWQLSQRRRR